MKNIFKITSTIESHLFGQYVLKDNINGVLSFKSQCGEFDVFVSTQSPIGDIDGHICTIWKGYSRIKHGNLNNLNSELKKLL